MSSDTTTTKKIIIVKKKKQPLNEEVKKPDTVDTTAIKATTKLPNKTVNKTTPLTSVDTIITFKRITHAEVYDLLISGHFIDKTIQKTITVNESKIKVSKEFSDNPNAGIFISDPNKKNSILLCSTNQSKFDYYTISNSDFDSEKEKICDWCRIRFTHQSKGMAIAYKEFYHGEKICRVFWIYGCHCDERCALAEIEEEEKKASHLSSLDLPTARSMTNFLYYVTTGMNPIELRPRCYWRLLKRNGGTIEDKDEPRNIFKDTGNIYLLPAKTLFEKYEI